MEKGVQPSSYGYNIASFLAFFLITELVSVKKVILINKK